MDTTDTKTMNNKDKIEELLASMAREQVKFNQIKTFFDKPRYEYTEEDVREITHQFLDSMGTLSRFEKEYQKVIGLLV